MQGKGGQIRGSFNKWWYVYHEFTHYKAIIEINNRRVIGVGLTEREAFDQAYNKMSSYGDCLTAHYLVEFDNQFNKP